MKYLLLSLLLFPLISFAYIESGKKIDVYCISFNSVADCTLNNFNINNGIIEVICDGKRLDSSLNNCVITEK